MDILTHTPVAVLSAQADCHPVAVLALDLSADSDGWQQLLPAGRFKAIDGRPFDVPGGHWFLDEAIARRLIDRARSSTNDLVIDYEHQTLNSEKNGQPAPAAGWFKGEMEWRESGLWIRPTWTARAREHIQNDEYRFLSAVFPYDKTTGEPLALHSAALVNRPGIDGLQAVAALNASFPTQQEPPMNEHLRKLLAQLGIELAEDAEISDEQAVAALSALDALQCQSSRAAELETEVAALKAAEPGTGVDLSRYVPVETYNALVSNWTALKAGSEKDSVDRLITDAFKEGRIFESEKDYLKGFAKQQGVAALKALIAGRPAVAALSGQQTDVDSPSKPEGRNRDSDLNDEDMAVLKATGLDRDAYLKSKQELN